MSNRKISKIVRAQAVPEGKGVTALLGGLA